MKARAPRGQAKSVIDLLEEAIALLRAAPGSALVTYYLGAVPFWLGVLYFVADMSHSAFATDRLVAGSLGVTLLFIWMKCWQAVFTSRLRCMLLLDSEEAWTGRRVLRLVAQQASVQPWGLLIRPLALIVTVPFVWVAAFYQNITVLGDGGSSRDERSLFSRAWQQAQLWPGQAHTLVSLLFLFGVFVWMNVVTALAAAPWLLKTFLDIETEASRSMGALLNSTVLAATLALTLLCIDPIFKAVYVLRCFYGESLRTGEDLRMQLRRARGAVATMALMVTLFFCQAVHSPAAESVREKGSAVSSVELDRSIDEVLQRREYAWRTPRREQVKSEETGWAKDVLKWFVDTYRWISKNVKKWFSKNDRKPIEMGSSGGGGLPVDVIAYALLAVAGAVGAVALWRRMRQPQPDVTDAHALPALPDLHADDVVADQLPEDGWLDLMRKALADGQRRLALRAAYLASLAHLGQRELLTIARYKSNRDYSRELQRRARSRDTLLSAFGENMEAFERAWYGRHEVSDATLEQFTRNLETIRAC
ncbi:DUF4129 domain-containing protein [Verrucomicrobiota bacterium sgz303538]